MRNYARSVEAWKQRRLRAGRTANTVLRDLFTLSSVLTRAVKFGELPENPIRRLDRPKIDHSARIRFFNEPEETRLRQVLQTRDREMAEARSSANA